MRWPWRKSSDVEDALSGSAERLNDARQRERELEPKVAKLRESIARNHFESAVLHAFTVVRER